MIYKFILTASARICASASLPLGSSTDRNASPCGGRSDQLSHTDSLSQLRRCPDKLWLE
jgi:hypothetical protein